MAGSVLGVSEALRIYIIDDEHPAVRRLERLVDARPDAAVCGSATDPDHALAQCRELVPDVVLADVEMPGLDGMALAESLRRLPVPPAIVFVTAFEGYAVGAFELAAVDYLVKPVRPERLARALERARVHPRIDHARLQSRMGERVISIPLAEVRALVAEDKYTTVHYPEGPALVEDSLVRIERRFPGQFLRIHRKALVATRYLRGLHRDPEGSERVELAGIEYCPPVSRRNLPVVRKHLRQQT